MKKIFLVKCEKKIQVVQNFRKWQEKWSKLIFGILRPPTQKIWGANTKFRSKMENCSKLPEMARKLVENDFWIF